MPELTDGVFANGVLLGLLRMGCDAQASELLHVLRQIGDRVAEVLFIPRRTRTK